jgi:hypothetical protein
MGKKLSTFSIRYVNFILHTYSGGIGGLGGLGGFGGLGGLGGLGGVICGVPIGFGVTTTIGGSGPYGEELLMEEPFGYGPYLGPTGVPPRGVAGTGGAINRALHRGPYRGYY